MKVGTMTHLTMLILVIHFSNMAGYYSGGDYDGLFNVNFADGEASFSCGFRAILVAE